MEFFCFSSGHIKICEYIVANKLVDENKTDFKERTALKIAEDNDYNDLVEILKRNKVAAPPKENINVKKDLYDSESSESDNEEFKKELANLKEDNDDDDKKWKKENERKRSEIDSSASESEKEQKKMTKTNVKKDIYSSDSDV